MLDARMHKEKVSGSHDAAYPARPADAEHARLLGQVLGVVVVLVGRQPLSAADAVADRRTRRTSHPLSTKPWECRTFIADN